MEVILKTKDLTKKYGDKVVVDNLNIEIKKGEIFGLLGPNGAGKSTTMNMICEVIKPTLGTIEFMGGDIRKNRKKLLSKLGYIPQELAIHGNLKAWENVELFTSLYGIKGEKLKNIVDESLDYVGLLDKRNEYAKNFSGGMKRRLNIACAIGHEPDLLIFDEPTVGLDPKQIIEVRDLIKNLSKKHTILLSSHILQEVQAVCDKLVIINHGRIVAIDTPEALSRNILQINKLELRIKGPKNDILRGIQDLDGVVEAEILRIREEGTVDIRVETDDETDVRGAVFTFCAENNYPIYMMRTDEINLEDIFLQVTGEREARRR